jgi:hypothetical protein
MEVLTDLLKFVHVIGFVFMTVPLFNLIVVNERALLGVSFNYYADRYMENIIKHGAYRCFVWIVLVKTILLFTLMGLLSYVHFRLQPRIESLISDITPDSEISGDLVSQLKPYRVRRKWLATVCLFLVLTSIILGLQVYALYNPLLTIGLIILAGLFTLKVNKTLIRFGWI